MDSISFFVVYFLIWLSPSLILIPPPLFAEKLSVSLLELCAATPLLIMVTLVADYVPRFEYERL